MRTTRAAGVAFLVGATALAGATGAAARPDRAPGAARFTARVSLTSKGHQVRGPEQFLALSVSAGGRFVAFDSRNSHLVPGDTNGLWDVFVRDRRLGTTERVSVTSRGKQANGYSYLGGISGNGRYVVFQSSAPNLRAGGSGLWNVYVRDLKRHVTIPVSVNRRRMQVGGAAGDISYDGRYVTFGDTGTALAPGNNGHFEQLFRRDMWRHRTVELTVSRSGGQANGDSYAIHQLSGGRRVMFETYASNLVPRGWQGIVVRNIVTRRTHLVVKRPMNHDGDTFYDFDVSADGTIVAFHGYRPGCPPNCKTGIYVKNRRTGNIRLISVNNGGGPSNVWCNHPSVSADGRFVSYDTFRNVRNPGLGPRTLYGQLFVRDRRRGRTVMVSVSPAGARGSSGSWGAELAGDGRYVGFFSYADNLVRLDTNHFADAFIRRFR